MAKDGKKHAALGLMAGGYSVGGAKLYSHAQMEAHRDAPDDKGERKMTYFVNW